ncbi:MAG TPA: MFS transporter [Acetobacteraceae bacterium]|nr:MFS transporter [Acetobacteraceae bacterium]
MILSERRYQMLGAAWLAWMVNYIDRTKTAVLLPLIVASLGLSTHQTGWVLFSFFICYAATQPFAGFVTDLLGAKKALALSVGGFSVFTWMMGMVNTPDQLLILNGLFGIFAGFEVTSASRLVATWFPMRTRGRAFAFHQTAYTIGPVIVPFIAVPIAHALGSWRWTFLIMAFFGLPVLALIDRYIVDRPERDPRISDAELDYIFGKEEIARKQGGALDPARARSANELPPGERLTPYREIFFNRSIALMFASGFFCLLAGWGLTTWLPTYGYRELKLPLLISGTLASIVWAGQFCGVVVGGILSDKVFGMKRTPIWILGGVVMAMALVWAATFKPGVGLPVVYLAFFIAGFAGSCTPAGQLFAPYLAELLTPGAVGRSLGVVVLGAMIGSAVAQPLTAYMVIQTPAGPQFWPAFLLFAACGVLGSACVCGMVEPQVRRTYLGYLLSGGKEGQWKPQSQPL